MADTQDVKTIKAVKAAAGELGNNSGKVIIGITGGYVQYREVIADLQHEYSREVLHMLCIGAYMTPDRKVYVVYKLNGDVDIIDDKINFKEHLPFVGLESRVNM